MVRGRSKYNGHKFKACLEAGRVNKKKSEYKACLEASRVYKTTKGETKQ